MEKELFPEGPDLQPLEPKPSPLVKLRNAIKNKYILAGLGFLVIISMGTYILIAPSQDLRTIASAPLPTLTPTLTPIPPTPSATPLPAPPTSTPIPPPTLTPTPTIPPGTLWKTYSNTQYGYRIKYSPDWLVKDLGQLEPQIPSYINFHPKSASESSRFITIGVTTRTYEEQLALSSSSSAITVAGIKGTKQYFRDSDGNTSTVVVLPRPTHLIVLRAKTAYIPYFDLMLSTLYVAQ